MKVKRPCLKADFVRLGVNDRKKKVIKSTHIANIKIDYTLAP